MSPVDLWGGTVIDDQCTSHCFAGIAMLSVIPIQMIPIQRGQDGYRGICQREVCRHCRDGMDESSFFESCEKGCLTGRGREFNFGLERGEEWEGSRCDAQDAHR